LPLNSDVKLETSCSLWYSLNNWDSNRQSTWKQGQEDKESIKNPCAIKTQNLLEHSQHLIDNRIAPTCTFQICWGYYKVHVLPKQVDSEYRISSNGFIWCKT
jgi:hypothetical protein